MQSTQTPTLIPLPFASGGGKNTIPEASQLPGNPGGASFTDGFPPATRTPLVAGGIPPAGLDMNGILYMITQSTRWSHAGGLYSFSSSFAADTNVGGYPNGAELMSADLQGTWVSLNDNNTDNPDTGAGTKWVPGRAYGTTAIGGLTNANVTLTPAQAAKNKITLAGTLTGNIQVILPAWIRDWTIVNNTTGAFTITAKTAGGTGVVLAAGQQKVTGDGTNIVQPPESVAAATLSTHAVQFGQAQASSSNVGIDTGTANAYVVAYTPALTAPVPWAPFWFKVKTTNTGASTLNTTGTAYALVGGAHQPLQGGELVAGGDALVFWNPTLNGGAGQHVLLFCSGAPEQVATATQSQHAVPLGQLQGLITNMSANTSSGSFVVPANVTKLKYRAVGAGGGGGASIAASSAAGGAGSGSYSEGILQVTPGQTISFTVGAGGAQGTSGSGGLGGTTTITGTGISVSCPGGSPSGVISATGVGAQGGGGVLPTVSGANVAPYLSASGVPGQIGVYGGGSGYFGGNGAPSVFGGGGLGNSGYPGGSGTAYGAGGAGGANNNFGQPGSGGIVIFEW
ncbi:MAG: hypothetical protein VYB88_17950 [Pseudomonadota bacterium]|nr:hypothetical protein [Pseudomonadota bacterium]